MENNFWSQFLIEYLGGMAAAGTLAFFGYLARLKIAKIVRHTLRRLEHLEKEWEGRPRK